MFKFQWFNHAVTFFVKKKRKEFDINESTYRENSAHSCSKEYKNISIRYAHTPEWLSTGSVVTGGSGPLLIGAYVLPSC